MSSITIQNCPGWMVGYCFLFLHLNAPYCSYWCLHFFHSFAASLFNCIYPAEWVTTLQNLFAKRIDYLTLPSWHILFWDPRKTTDTQNEARRCWSSVQTAIKWRLVVGEFVCIHAHSRALCWFHISPWPCGQSHLLFLLTHHIYNTCTACLVFWPPGKPLVKNLSLLMILIMMDEKEISIKNWNHSFPSPQTYFSILELSLFTFPNPFGTAAVFFHSLIPFRRWNSAADHHWAFGSHWTDNVQMYNIMELLTCRVHRKVASLEWFLWIC